MSAFGKKQASAADQYAQKEHNALPNEVPEQVGRSKFSRASGVTPRTGSETPEPSASQPTSEPVSEPTSTRSDVGQRPQPFRRNTMSPPGGTATPEGDSTSKPEPAAEKKEYQRPKPSSYGKEHQHQDDKVSSGGSNYNRATPPVNRGSGGFVAPAEEGYAQQVQSQSRPLNPEFQERLEVLAERYGDSLNKVVIAKGLPVRLERLIDEVADFLGYGQEERVEAYLKGMLEPEEFAKKLTLFRDQKIIPARRNSSASFGEALAKNPDSIVFHQINPRGDSSFVVLDRNTEEGQENAVLHGAVIEVVAASRTPFPNPTDFFNFEHNVVVEDDADFSASPVVEKTSEPVEAPSEPEKEPISSAPTASARKPFNGF